jgi:hypothetical protein
LNCKAGVAYVSELGLNLEIEHGLFQAGAVLESAAAYVSERGLNLEIEHGLFHAQAVVKDANEKAMPNTSFLLVVHTCYAVQASSISTVLSRPPPPPPPSRTSIFVQTRKLQPTRTTIKRFFEINASLGKAQNPKHYLQLLFRLVCFPKP